MEVIFEEGFPEKEELRRKLAAYTEYAPTWIHVLKFGYDRNNHPDDSSTYMTTSINFGYRRAWIRLHPLYTELNEEEFHECILHEITHLFHLPMSHLMESILTQAVQGEMANILREQLSEKIEGTASDFAAMLRCVIPLP